MNTIYQDYLEKRKSLIKETITKEKKFCNDIYKIIIEEQYYFEGDTNTFKLYSIHINGNYDNTYIRLPKDLRNFFNL